MAPISRAISASRKPAKSAIATDGMITGAQAASKASACAGVRMPMGADGTFGFTAAATGLAAQKPRGSQKAKKLCTAAL